MPGKPSIFLFFQCAWRHGTLQLVGRWRCRPLPSCPRLSSLQLHRGQSLDRRYGLLACPFHRSPVAPPAPIPQIATSDCKNLRGTKQPTHFLLEKKTFSPSLPAAGHVHVCSRPRDTNQRRASVPARPFQGRPRPRQGSARSFRGRARPFQRNGRPFQRSAKPFPKQASAIRQDCKPRVPNSRPSRFLKGLAVLNKAPTKIANQSKETSRTVPCH